MSKIEILQQFPAPPVHKRRTTLLYRTGGEKFSTPFEVAIPAYYDDIIVVQGRMERHQPPDYRGSAGSFGQVAKSALRKVQRAALKRGPALELSGPILDLRCIEPNNLTHLLFNIIPYSLLARRVLGRPAHVLTMPMKDVFRALLARFAVTPLVTTRPVSGNLVRLLGSRGLSVYELWTTFDCDGINFLPSTYDEYSFPPPERADVGKLFVARKDKRALLNHREVEAFLSARGYTTVYFEDYPLDEQLSLAAHATDIVAIHGAAMGFFALGSRLNSIVELSPPHIHHHLFANSLDRCPIYKVIISEFDPQLAYQGWGEIQRFKNRPFACDMALLEDALAGL